MATEKIVIFGTGGTIAGQAASQTQGVGYQAGQITIEGLLKAVPDLPQVAGMELSAIQLAQIDSKDMDWSVWRTALKAVADALNDPQVQAVVMTHGTDTLEETAWLLQTVLQPHKPVVLTCAMRPATSIQADGPQNLRDAVAVAARGGRAGVWVVAAGDVHSAAQVQKVHPYRLNALRSYEGGPSGFVEEGAVRWVQAEGVSLAANKVVAKTSGLSQMQQRLLQCDALPWVEIVVSGALQSSRTVDALLAGGVQGIVLAGTGNATVHADLLAALERAKAQGVWVWCTTRCIEGLPVCGAGTATPVKLSGDAASLMGADTWLVAAPNVGEPDWVMLAPNKARIAMMLALALKD